MKRFNSLIPFLTLIVIILVSFSASCDKRNPPPIIPTPPEPPSLSDMREITSIKAVPDTIYADNNVTFSRISVQVKDGENFGVRNQMVNFKTDIGNIITDVTTDSTGVATSTFWDSGDTGMATIVAIVRNFHETVKDSIISMDSDTIRVYIAPVPEIDQIKLEAKNSAVVAGVPIDMEVQEVIPFTARPLYADGTNLPDNSLVTFSCTQGYFVASDDTDLGLETVVKTVNGRATVRYNSGTSSNVGPGEELGSVTASIGGVESDALISISPDAPSSILLKSFVDGVPSQTSDVGSSSEIMIKATLKDRYSNECPDEIVKFNTDLGTFANTAQNSSATTDEYGIASVRFTPGLLAGAATIKASANNDTLNTQIIFTISSDDVQSMDFTQEEAIELNVAETGGVSSAILRVKLRDINYNLVDRPFDVRFRIMNTNVPTGANLNGHSPANDWVTVTSNGGEAQVSVNAGTGSGVLRIQAECTNDAGMTITANKPNVIIHAGLPATITPSMAGYDQGNSMQGGVWQVVASANVRDKHNNPVSLNTPVWFSIVSCDENGNPADSVHAQIEAFGTVGNVSIEGDSLLGVAFTTVTYHGSQTNKYVRIVASSGDAVSSTLGADGVFQLPITGPELIVYADPQNLNFGNAGTNVTPASLTTDIRIWLLDGQGIPITDSHFHLSSDKGQFNISNPAPGPNDPDYLSYCLDPSNPQYIRSIDGYSLSRFKTFEAEHPDPQDESLSPEQSTANVGVRLLGSTIEPTPAVITVWTFWGPPPF
ncbi:MAG: hypothetical protein WC190_05575 [Candidatus Cloacimonadaceae bacterium]